MSNELRQMQEFLAAHNRQQGMALGRAEADEATDDEGFGVPAPAPPINDTKESADEMALATSNPRAALQEYQLNKYPPEIHAIDLKSMQVIGSHGRFALEETEARQVIAIAVMAMKRQFENILQTLAERAGLSDAASGPITEGGNASDQPSQEPPDVPLAPSGRRRSRGVTG